jgi:hypothetical protein
METGGGTSPRPFVIYVAGPIAARDGLTLWDHVRAGMAAAHQVIAAGAVPVLPHLFYFLDIELPGRVDYEGWMRLDFALLARCDGLWRIGGESPGATREVAEAMRIKLPIARDLQTLLAELEASSSTLVRMATGGTFTGPPLVGGITAGGIVPLAAPIICPLHGIPMTECSVSSEWPGRKWMCPTCKAMREQQAAARPSRHPVTAMQAHIVAAPAAPPLCARCHGDGFPGCQCEVPPMVHLFTGFKRPDVLVACKEDGVQNCTPAVDDVTCPDCLTALVVTP